MHFPTSQVLHCNHIGFLITESWQQPDPWHSWTGFFLPLFASFVLWFTSIFRKFLNISQPPLWFIQKKKASIELRWGFFRVSKISIFIFLYRKFFATTMNFAIANMCQCFPHNSRPQNTSLQWAFKSTLSKVLHVAAST